jgi:hypothetical protein
LIVVGAAYVTGRCRAASRHLKLLAAAAAMFSDRAFREKLRACIDSMACLALLVAWPELISSSGSTSRSGE